MNVTLLGTGLLGFAMAERLIGQEHSLTVYNRTKSKTQPLADQGAQVAESPAEAVEASNTIILMLSDYPAIEEVLFGGSVDFNGKSIIQMGTISPRQSVDIASRVNDAGGDYAECPVLGSRGEANAGTLILMFGGSEAQFKQHAEFLKVFGPNPTLIGEVGQAAALKLAMNQLIAAHASSFSLSLGFVEKSGVDRETFMSLLRESSLYAPMFDKKMSRMVDKHYDGPNFSTKHLLKDIQLFVQAASMQGMNTKALEGIANVTEQAIDQGLGEQDYISLFETIKGNNE